MGILLVSYSDKRIKTAAGARQGYGKWPSISTGYSAESRQRYIREADGWA